MSRHTSGRNRSTLVGVFLILALFPAAFTVAFQIEARGIESGRPWLVAVFPLVLLVAAYVIPRVWQRLRLLGVLLGGVAAGAAGLLCLNMAAVFEAAGATGAVRFLAPAGISVLYGLFGLVMGWRHSQESRTGRGSAPRVVAASREGLSR